MSNHASNLKSQPTVFGISRPTRTPTKEPHRSTPWWTGRRPRAGLPQCSRPGRPPAANYPRPHVRPQPLYRARGAQPHEPGRRAEAGPPGEPAARAMARRPPPGIAAPQPPSGGGKRHWIARLDARLSRPSPAAVSVFSPVGNRSQPRDGASTLRRLTRTGPANYEPMYPRGHQQHAQAVTPVNMFPALPAPGPGATSE
jgi:hypothetical protein